MDTATVAIWLAAAALIVHTIEEAWLPYYQEFKPSWRSLIFNRSLFLEHGPIFAFVIVLAIIGWRSPVISGLLPAISLTHALLDHGGLSWKSRSLRPGSWTGIFLLIPISIWLYIFSVSNNLFELHELLISGVIGTAISVWLFWMVDQELKNRSHPHQ
ncbi:MAG: HXXEE domain-containing protein [Cyanobacteria bacterium P01_C01_bin.89]